MGLLGTSTTWRSFKMMLSRCGATSAQSCAAILPSKRLRTSVRKGDASFMTSAPASADMAGNPFGYETRRPEIRQSPRRELSDAAPNSHAYFRTETYGFYIRFRAIRHANSPYTECISSVYGSCDLARKRAEYGKGGAREKRTL